MVRALMKLGIYFRGLLMIHLSLRRLFMFVNIQFLILAHSIIDLIMLLFGVISVILLIMI